MFTVCIPVYKDGSIEAAGEKSRCPDPGETRQGSPSHGLRRSSRTFQAPAPPPGLSQGVFLCRVPLRKTHPRPRVHLCTQKPPPGSRDHGARWGPRLRALPTGFKARPHPPLSQVQTSPPPHAPFMWFPSNLKTPPPRGLCTRGRFLQSPFEKPGASQAQISPVQSACLHRPPMRRGPEGVQAGPGSTKGVASTFSGPATAPSSSGSCSREQADAGQNLPVPPEASGRGSSWSLGQRAVQGTAACVTQWLSPALPAPATRPPRNLPRDRCR